LSFEARRSERVRAPITSPIRPRAVAAALLAALAAAPAALAHGGNPHYLSQVDAITPATEGVTVEVLNRDDRLLLHNTSGEDVVIEGYDKEPYARVRADGTVEVNTRSPAYYVNDDRFGNVDAPDGIDGSDPPQWKQIDKTGRFEWHDHRFHWMSASTTPSQVKDKSVKTKVFDWKVPVEIGGRRGAIAGTLFWTPLPGGGPPLAAIFAGAGFLIACCIAVAVVRYRRRTATERPAQEAW
jgi:hypothetical protein